MEFLNSIFIKNILLFIVTCAIICMGIFNSLYYFTSLFVFPSVNVW
jgi:hypothetical protein